MRASSFSVFAAAARRVQHHAHLDAALFRGDHGAEQSFVGEQEHADVQRLLAPLMASRIGFDVSSGRTISVCDIEVSSTGVPVNRYFTFTTGEPFQVPSSASGFGQ